MSSFPEDRRSWEVQLRPWALGWELWVDGTPVTQTSRNEGPDDVDPEVMMRDWIATVYERPADKDVIKFTRDP